MLSNIQTKESLIYNKKLNFILTSLGGKEKKLLEGYKTVGFKMPRIIIHKEKSPVEIKCGNESKWICQCGLSKNKPLCDGSHNKTLDEKEDKIYAYDEEQKGIEL